MYVTTSCRVLPSAHRVRGEAEVEEARFGQQALALRAAQPLAGLGAREERVERRDGDRLRVLVGEAHRGPREEACLRGVVEEALEAAPLGVAEVVADGLAEVGAQRVGRAAEARGVRVGDGVAAGFAPLLRGEQEALVVAREDARTRAPRREHEGQARLLEPRKAEVEHVRKAASSIASAEGRR